ncbi:MAG: hypothetical protein IPN33_14575 [Saprospiraceae bacterium]|nr:hypothetical protein [Saprospiraceae bacterium]
MSSANDKSNKRAKPNYLYAVISVASVLLLVGFFGLIILYAQRVVQLYKERVNLLVELKEGVDEAARERLAGYLSGMPYFKPGSLTYVSKAEAAEQMRETFGEDFLRLDMPNPFYDVVTFNVRASYMHADSLNAIRSPYGARSRQRRLLPGKPGHQSRRQHSQNRLHRPGYRTLFYLRGDHPHPLHRAPGPLRQPFFNKKHGVGGRLLGIHQQTLSLPRYSTRRPERRHSFGGLILLTLWIQRNLPELQTLNIQTGMGLLAMILIVLGILINTWSTYIVVKKYLTMRVDDMY